MTKNGQNSSASGMQGLITINQSYATLTHFCRFPDSDTDKLNECVKSARDRATMLAQC